MAHDVPIEDDEDETTTEAVVEETNAEDARARFEAILSELSYIRSCFHSKAKQIAFVVRRVDRLDLDPSLMVELKNAINVFNGERTSDAWSAIDAALLHLEEALEAQAAA